MIDGGQKWTGAPAPDSGFRPQGPNQISRRAERRAAGKTGGGKRGGEKKSKKKRARSPLRASGITAGRVIVIGALALNCTRSGLRRKAASRRPGSAGRALCPSSEPRRRMTTMPRTPQNVGRRAVRPAAESSGDLAKRPLRRLPAPGVTKDGDANTVPKAPLLRTPPTRSPAVW
ncbi:hypothetical protein HPB51_001854 [Rhipicephalus microplus]|uniref:Uncharacterized protein n=1 Tax=Rhipicephalus microplus TaxID=6941 RepID=A0A9J6D8E8_RHIMP|nr:hypothetical protein HPB51_001854 [Rhipicephalus microplus]